MRSRQNVKKSFKLYKHQGIYTWNLHKKCLHQKIIFWEEINKLSGTQTMFEYIVSRCTPCRTLSFLINTIPKPRTIAFKHKDMSFT